MRGRRWDLRNGGGLLSGSSSNNSSSSDDIPPEEREPIDPPPPEISFDSTMFLSESDSLSDSSSDKEPHVMSEGAKKSNHLLEVIDELNEATRARIEATSEHSETEPPSTSISLSSSDPDETEYEISEDEPRSEPVRGRVMTSLTRTPPTKAQKETPKQSRPKESDRKKMYVDTVKAIHEFFQGTYSIETILQAIHGCAGDYRAATKKLVTGFRGCSILEIPTAAQSSITPDQLRKYLRGDE